MAKIKEVTTKGSITLIGDKVIANFTIVKRKEHYQIDNGRVNANIRPTSRTLPAFQNAIHAAGRFTFFGNLPELIAMLEHADMQPT